MIHPRPAWSNAPIEETGLRDPGPMDEKVGILVAEDDEGHFALIQRNLQRAGVKGPILRFSDGQEILDFLFARGEGRRRRNGETYVLLLDIRMPKVDGLDVLRRLRADAVLRRVPVIILTTTDDPVEVEHSYRAGCGLYIAKPVQYDRFVETIRRIGMFLSIVRVPRLDGEPAGREPGE